MKILEMTASFGCLDHRTLRLRDGVNLFVLPNEQGKSTWAAFLLAMFYGIDSAERAAKGRLPAKVRYQPWNGAPMEGTVTLEHEGRKLVLQRTSLRGKPMGQFRAYDLETGLDIPELTGDNCGKKLLGVEKEVFRRTAFLSGGELAVTQEQDLARRLANLAASGDAAESYPAAAERLKNWKNRLQRSLIPQTVSRLQAQNRLQTDRETLRARQTLLQQQIAALEQEQTAVPKERNISPFLLLLAVDLAAVVITASKNLWIPVILSVILLIVTIILYYANNKRNKKVRALQQQAQDRETGLRHLQTELAVTQARLADLPREDTDPAGELEELQFREQALELAMEALEQAEAELAKGYGPRLTACAGQLLEALTAQRYNGIILDRELHLSLREASTGLVRPLTALSKGTQDQAWLALRLAMTRLLLPKHGPIVLDDALLTFDDGRTAAALSLLQQEDRQVLLLSCREL